MKSIRDLISLVAGDHGTVFLVANLVVILCVITVLLAILIDFVRYHRPAASKREKKSLVETGSMLLYFFVFCFLLQTSFGRLDLPPVMAGNLVILAGITLVLTGCFVNVSGRFALRHNWANQVTIYRDQTLVRGGIYRYVRHPLYASLIWMFLGCSLIYSHLTALLSVVLVFIPMMVYRARQEERFLLEEFEEYPAYRKRTGMFFPKIHGYEKI
jgi:protein-S-isoprenylcysteine O-methyltransferase Ste14